MTAEITSTNAPPPRPPVRTVLVIGGFAFWGSVQHRLMELLYASHVYFDEIHVVSSGATAAFYMATMLAGAPAGAFVRPLEAAARACILRPWRGPALTNAGREEYRRAATLLGAQALNAR